MMIWSVASIVLEVVRVFHGLQGTDSKIATIDDFKR